MTYSKSQNAALFILRIVIAAIFFVAAYSKIPFWSGNPYGLNSFNLNLTRFLSIAESLGALAILLGFLTRWAAIGSAIIMVGAIYYSQFVYGIGFVTPTSAGWNFPLCILAGCIILIAFGAGGWSVDASRGKTITGNN
ncbi:MAG: DoxX family protein [Chitinophagaceae bacterium]